MRRRAPPADEHSELSSAVLRLTTQWELKQQRKEAALQATLDEAREDAEELREELEELRRSLAAARREAGDAAASAARADAEAADAKRELRDERCRSLGALFLIADLAAPPPAASAEAPAAAAAASDDDDDYDDDDRPPPADDGSESDRSAASSDDGARAPAAGAPSEAARAAASRRRAHAAALGVAGRLGAPSPACYAAAAREGRARLPQHAGARELLLECGECVLSLALAEACVRGHARAAAALLDAGAVAERACAPRDGAAAWPCVGGDDAEAPGAPALHRAIAAGHDDVAKLLIRLSLIHI